MKPINQILTQQELSRDDIINLLSIKDKDEHEMLLQKAYAIKENFLGKKVYIRALIELTNMCRKNCIYCALRTDNKRLNRYSLSDEEVIERVTWAMHNKFLSIMLQSGEQGGKRFVDRIYNLILEIKKVNPEFRITLALGQHTHKEYKQWFDAGARRYMLGIDRSSGPLIGKPSADDLHVHITRLRSIQNIKEIGYQTGTGMMIGLPFQTIVSIADDLIQIINMNVDMISVAPYLEHPDTPLYKYKNKLMTLSERFDLSLRVIAIARIMMPFINIASMSALQTIVPIGRELALKAGANIFMPNITPAEYRKRYPLYQNHFSIDEEAEDSFDMLERRINMIGEEISYKAYGDPKHFTQR